MSLNKNWNALIKPSKLHCENINDNVNLSKIVVEPLERGFGLTLANALRRVLLSSLQGSAVTSVKVMGVDHEFTSIPGVKEDMVDLILNLKSLVVKMHTNEKRKVSLKATGPCIVTGSMIDCGSDVEVLNRNHVICSLSEGFSIDMELICEMGKGYVPAFYDPEEDVEIGVIAIDALFSPVRKVSYRVENSRVGQITDYDRLIMEIETNGTIQPELAIALAARILQDQMKFFINFEDSEEEIQEKEAELPFNPIMLKKISDIEISVRSQNCLRGDNIVYLGDLAIRTEGEMLKTPNFGRKSLNELRHILTSYGLSFGMKIPSWPPENCAELSKKYQDEIY